MRSANPPTDQYFGPMVPHTLVLQPTELASGPIRSLVLWYPLVQSLTADTSLGGLWSMPFAEPRPSSSISTRYTSPDYSAVFPYVDLGVQRCKLMRTFLTLRLRSILWCRLTCIRIPHTSTIALHLCSSLGAQNPDMNASPTKLPRATFIQNASVRLRRLNRILPRSNYPDKSDEPLTYYSPECTHT